MTEAQDQDEQRFRRYVAREGLASFMNDTKWRELIAAIQSIKDYQPSFRVKCVRDDEPPADRWDRSFPFHIPTFREIEWLEFDPLVRSHGGALSAGRCTDFGPQIEAALAHVSVAFQRHQHAIRIVGYSRPMKT